MRAEKIRKTKITGAVLALLASLYMYVDNSRYQAARIEKSKLNLGTSISLSQAMQNAEKSNIKTETATVAVVDTKPLEGAVIKVREFPELEKKNIESEKIKESFESSQISLPLPKDSDVYIYYRYKNFLLMFGFKNNKKSQEDKWVLELRRARFHLSVMDAEASCRQKNCFKIPKELELILSAMDNGAHDFDSNDWKLQFARSNCELANSDGHYYISKDSGSNDCQVATLKAVWVFSDQRLNHRDRFYVTTLAGD